MRRILVFVNSAKICQAVKIDIYEPIYNKNWKSGLVNMIHDPSSPKRVKSSTGSGAAWSVVGLDSGHLAPIKRSGLEITTVHTGAHTDH